MRGARRRRGRRDRPRVIGRVFCSRGRCGYETGREGGAVGERFRRGEVVAEAEDQAVGAIVGGRAEEAGHDDAGGHGAADFGGGLCRGGGGS